MGNFTNPFFSLLHDFIKTEGGVVLLAEVQGVASSIIKGGLNPLLGIDIPYIGILSLTAGVGVLMCGWEMGGVIEEWLAGIAGLERKWDRGY